MSIYLPYPPQAPIYVGSAVELPMEMRDQAGALADPPQIRCDVRDPMGTLYSLVVTRAAAGVYRAVFVPWTHGEWIVLWTTGGALPTVSPQRIEVRRTLTPRPRIDHTAYAVATIQFSARARGSWGQIGRARSDLTVTATAEGTALP